MGDMAPERMTYDQLADVLEAVAQWIRAGASWEGWLAYNMDLDSAAVLVRGMFRIGNLQDQGDMRVIGTLSPTPGPGELDADMP